MVAALSPADINYDETLSTLRCVRGAWTLPVPHQPAWAGVDPPGASLQGRLTWTSWAPDGWQGTWCFRVPFHFPPRVASSGPGPCRLTGRAGLAG